MSLKDYLYAYEIAGNHVKGRENASKQAKVPGPSAHEEATRPTTQSPWLIKYLALLVVLRVDWDLEEQAWEVSQVYYRAVSAISSTLARVISIDGFRLTSESR